MIANCLVLLRIQLLSLFGFNKAIHSRNPKERRKLLFLMIGIGLLALLFLAYSALFAAGLAAMNLAGAIPAVMLTVAACITLVTTILKANGSLFGLRDYDIVMAMPVTNAAFIAGKVLFFYVLALLFSLVILLPCSIVYGIAVSASVMTWILLFLSLFLAPLLPLIVGTALGALITAVSVRFRHKNLVSTLLGLVLICGIFVLSLNLQTESTADLNAMSEQLFRTINRVYPVAALFAGAVNDGNLMYFLWFTLLSVGSFLLFLALLSRWYCKINTAVTSYAAHSDYQLGELKSSSRFIALYQKEARRYASSPIYIINTVTGMILFLLFAAGLFITGTDIIEQLTKIPELSSLLAGLAPFIPAVFVVMSTTTCSSISLEGRSRWILSSMPVEAITIFNAKILWNMTIVIPPIFIGSGLLSAALKLSLLDSLLLIAVPCAYAWYIAVVGIVLNLKFPNFEFTSDMEVVKQGIPVLFTILTGFVSCAVPILVVMIPGSSVPPRMAAAAACILAAAAGVALHSRLRGKCIRSFLNESK